MAQIHCQLMAFYKGQGIKLFQLDEQNSFCPPQPLLCQMAPSILGLVLQRRRPDAADGKVMEELLGRQQTLANSQEACLERTPCAVFAQQSWVREKGVSFKYTYFCSAAASTLFLLVFYPYLCNVTGYSLTSLTTCVIFLHMSFLCSTMFYYICHI